MLLLLALMYVGSGLVPLFAQSCIFNVTPHQHVTKIFLRPLQIRLRSYEIETDDEIGRETYSHFFLPLTAILEQVHLPFLALLDFLAQLSIDEL